MLLGDYNYVVYLVCTSPGLYFIHMFTPASAHMLNLPHFSNLQSIPYYNQKADEKVDPPMV